MPTWAGQHSILKGLWCQGLTWCSQGAETAVGWGVCQPRADALGVALIPALIHRVPGLAPGSPAGMAPGPGPGPKTRQVLSHVFLLGVTSGQGDLAGDSSSFPGLVITPARTWQLGTALPFLGTSTHPRARGSSFPGRRCPRSAPVPMTPVPQWVSSAP